MEQRNAGEPVRLLLQNNGRYPAFTFAKCRSSTDQHEQSRRQNAANHFPRCAVTLLVFQATTNFHGILSSSRLSAGLNLNSKETATDAEIVFCPGAMVDPSDLSRSAYPKL